MKVTEKANIRRGKIGYSDSGMISTASKVATEAGVGILEKGGNAFDAAVAAAFCLGVTEPQASGLGGQSMAVLYLAQEGKALAIDGSSRVPFSFDPRQFPLKPLKTGVLATTVPSTPATLGYILERYGTMGLEEVLNPAIIAAREGFEISSLQHRLIQREFDLLINDPLAAKNFFSQGAALKANKTLKQTELADCLMHMAQAGWRDFYLGRIAGTIIADMEQRGGWLSQADLSQIPIPQERPALEASYRGLDYVTFPPPGAGQTLVKILNIMENFTPGELDLDHPLGILILAAAFRFAMRSRERMPIDPDLYIQSINKLMTDKTYAAEIADRIQTLLQIHTPELWMPPVTSGETTHLSVADRQGNMIGITQSIELVFGSKTTARGLGFFYNNYMSAFNYTDPTHPYYLLPGARPWSSVAPTIFFRNKRPFLLLGSPGSERISTTLAQVISRVLDGKKDLFTAIEAPRLHTRSSGRVSLENERISRTIIEYLSGTGFPLVNRGSYSFYLGSVQGILIGSKDEKPLFIGVADPRRDGTAKGPV